MSKSRNWEKANPEKVKEANRKYYLANREKVLSRNKEWKEHNREKWLIGHNRWIDENFKKVRDYKKKWDSNNQPTKNACTARYRAAKSQRVPKWANLEVIKEFYKNCPEDMTVDHIIPLRGKTVSGLHVENNLQYLTLSENSSKGARL